MMSVRMGRGIIAAKVSGTEMCVIPKCKVILKAGNYTLYEITQLFHMGSLNIEKPPEQLMHSGAKGLLFIESDCFFSRAKQITLAYRIIFSLTMVQRLWQIK